MEQELKAFTVEYQCPIGVLYFDNVTASSWEDAKQQVLQRNADVTIRAVSIVTRDDPSAH